MLDCTADATCYVHLRTDSHARLAYLSVVVNPSCIYGSATGTYLCVDFLCEVEQELETNDSLNNDIIDIVTETKAAK